MAQNKSIQVMACKIKRTVDSPWEIAVMVYGLQQNSAIDQQGKPIPAPICNPGLPPKQKPARIFSVSLGLPSGKVVTVSRVYSDEGQVACQFEPALESAADRTIAHALFSRAVLAVEKI